MKEELTQFFWIPFSPWPMVFVLAVIGFAMATLITFSFGKKHAATKTALLIPVVIVVGFCAIQAMGVLAGGRLVQLLELPDAEIKIQPVRVQSQRYVSIGPNTKGQVVPADEVMLSMDEVAPVVRIFKTFHPERTALNGLSSSGLAPNQH
jgi:hypothetical protein